jgi:hypothetical protein
MSAAGVYVYGIVPRDEPAKIPAAGINGAKVKVVEHDGLAALTSRIDADQIHVGRGLRAHWSVLQEACEAATVVPMRFGTVVEDEHAVRERLLEENAPHLDELLKQLRGCVQLVVKGGYVEDRLLGAIVSSSPALSALAARVRATPKAAAYYERIRLGEGISAAVEARRETDTANALAILEPAAVAARAEEVRGALDAFNLAFLVKRTAQEQFSGRVRKLVDAFGELVNVRYVGPLPPFSFAETEVLAGRN